MPPKLDLKNQQNDSDAKFFKYIENQNYTFVAGYIMYAIWLALIYDQPAKLIATLLFLCQENPEDLVALKIGDIAQPFKDINPNNLFREPDNVREESLLDESSDHLDGECPCEVAFVNGEPYVRWTLPRIEYIVKCKSINKLAHLALVALEELLHIKQYISPNTRGLVTLSNYYEFDAVMDATRMAPEDYEKLKQLLESDITFFFDTLLKGYEKLQWFMDRHNADDYHKSMSPQEYIEALIDLITKYGYPEEDAETLLEDVLYVLQSNVPVASAMLSSQKLVDFVDPKSALFSIAKFTNTFKDALDVLPELKSTIGSFLERLMQRLEKQTSEA